MPAKKPVVKTTKSTKSAPTAKGVVTKASAPKAPAKAPARKPEPPVVKASKKVSTKPETPKTVPSKATAVEKPVVAKPAPAKPAPAKVDGAKQPPRKKEVVATFVQRNPRPIVAPTEGEDGDETLLSGPRNVQPYIVKRGEQYMSREQLEHFRTILESWKHDLMREVDRTVSHMKDEAANFPDPNDRATQEEEFSLELRTRDRERKLIRKIEEALERIEDGSYGYCLETGEEIGIKRLEARPVATLSLEAQERRERREKQYGDRDDRYR
ncbi:MAG: RNA polymerase-binding protein DksA [Steroidobacteraceae bacterium]